ncbi:DUF6049 family protein [Streptantibioticus silvisoli]|uniref:DUF6049 family protein n=1 Tax=Streptantibioticus silvisoli TaxID=2705255 RepID=A0ABT6W2Y5_9ACTN|nr:DUF6049 family protein [Streptantibioticus silvisoli]MDI5965097.1 DUF6049 family protein [Streptantibioticus silvisoli]
MTLLLGLLAAAAVPADARDDARDDARARNVAGTASSGITSAGTSTSAGMSTSAPPSARSSGTPASGRTTDSGTSDADAYPVRVTLEALSPLWPKGDDTLTVRGQLVNTTPQRITGARLGVRVDGVARAAFDDQDLDPLGPGEKRSFTLHVPAGDLRLGNAGIHSFGVALTTADDVLSGLGSTRFPWAPDGVDGDPLDVAVLWPVTDEPHAEAVSLGWGDSAQPVFRDDALAGSFGTAGRLRELVDAADGLPVTWTVDPALLDEARSMAGGYRVAGVRDAGDPQLSRPGAGRAAATSWLGALRTAVKDQDVVALPYADPDVAALAHSGARSGTTSATWTAEAATRSGRGGGGGGTGAVASVRAGSASAAGSRGETGSRGAAGSAGSTRAGGPERSSGAARSAGSAEPARAAGPVERAGLTDADRARGGVGRGGRAGGAEGSAASGPGAGALNGALASVLRQSVRWGGAATAAALGGRVRDDVVWPYGGALDAGITGVAASMGSSVFIASGRGLSTGSSLSRVSLGGGASALVGDPAATTALSGPSDDASDLLSARQSLMAALLKARLSVGNGSGTSGSGAAWTGGADGSGAAGDWGAAGEGSGVTDSGNSDSGNSDSGDTDFGDPDFGAVANDLALTDGGAAGGGGLLVVPPRQMTGSMARVLSSVLESARDAGWVRLVGLDDLGSGTSGDLTVAAVAGARSPAGPDRPGPNGAEAGHRGTGAGPTEGDTGAERTGEEHPGGFLTGAARTGAFSARGAFSGGGAFKNGEVRAAGEGRAAGRSRVAGERVADEGVTDEGAAVESLREQRIREERIREQPIRAERPGPEAVSGGGRGSTGGKEGRTRSYPQGLRAGELSADDLSAVAAIQPDLGTLSRVLSDPGRTTDAVHRAMLRAVSTGWRVAAVGGDADDQRSYTGGVRAYVDNSIASVHLYPKHGTVTLAGDAASVPITVSNGLQQPLGGLELKVVSSAPNRVTLAHPATLVEAPPASNHTEQVKVRAYANGPVEMTAQLYTTSNHRPWGRPVTFRVQVSRLSPLVVGVIASGAFLVLLAGAVQARRVRRRDGRPPAASAGGRG